MRIAKTIIAAGLLVTGLSLAGCYGHPGHWGDHHHHHHDGDGDHHWR